MIEGVLPLLRSVFRGQEQESFGIVILDARMHVVAYREVARGETDRVEVPVREIFRTARMYDAWAIVLAHNHPSGDPQPSREDELLTHELVQAGASINLSVLDHVIIGGGDRYYSFREAATQAFGGANPLDDGKEKPNA